MKENKFEKIEKEEEKIEGEPCAICRSFKHKTIEHHEIGPNGVDIVAVEKLIPDINTENLYEKDESYWEKFSAHESHRHGDSAYSEEFYKMYQYQEEQYSEIFNRLKDQIVVDLGCGNSLFVYSAIRDIEAKSYVAVDLWPNAEKIKEKLMGNSDLSKMLFKQYRSKHKDRKQIPSAMVREDMLTFLKRLPDNSVSITAFGLQDDVIPFDYAELVEKEIERVLHPQGAMFTHYGVIRPDLPKARIKESREISWPECIDVYFKESEAEKDSK